MSPRDLIPLLLLALVALLAITTFAVVALAREVRRRGQLHLTRVPESDQGAPPVFRTLRSVLVQRPPAWLAIRSRSIEAVQSALGLGNPQPCTWIEGLSGERHLFIAPPVRGWIIVVGSNLPDPAEDVDACFRFLTGLSRKLGHVQFFSASRVLGQHAWARLENGRVVRAYAWADRTLWDQGVKTPAELELGIKCFRYLEQPKSSGFGPSDFVSSNTEKVPLLAARWSLDPAEIDDRQFEHARGVSGDGAADWY